jgi:calcineurin-like phosphoesterase family protein
MSVFVTSDEHYGHERIITLAKRPFASVEEMNETIIARHNKKVPNNLNHLTIHVGDMFWQTMTPQEAIDILLRLHGSHAFIYGNHDELMDKPSILKGLFTWIVGKNKASGSEIIKWNKHKITLNHYAQRVWDGSHKGHWHVYGHSHSALPDFGKSFDIGVDGHDFTPWSLEEIEAEMEKHPQHHTIDNTGAVDRVNEVVCKTCFGAGSCLDCLRVERAGSTIHASDCECGWCLSGYTRLKRMDV